MVKASFIMPLYNHQMFVKDAICSILRQTEPDFELIVVDDASTDKSYEIAEVYASVDPRIKLYRNEENLNSTKSYNIGASKATGEYIAVTSSDDIYAPHYLARVLAANADVVYAAYTFISSINSPMPWDKSLKLIEDHGFDYEYLKKNCYLFAGSMLVRRTIWEAVGGYDETFSVASDWDFSLRACADAKVTVLPEVLVYYRDLHIFSNRYRNEESDRAAERQRIRASYA